MRQNNTGQKFILELFKSPNRTFKNCLSLPKGETEGRERFLINKKLKIKQ